MTNSRRTKTYNEIPISQCRRLQHTRRGQHQSRRGRPVRETHVSGNTKRFNNLSPREDIATLPSRQEKCERSEHCQPTNVHSDPSSRVPVDAAETSRVDSSTLPTGKGIMRFRLTIARTTGQAEASRAVDGKTTPQEDHDADREDETWTEKNIRTLRCDASVSQF